MSAIAGILRFDGAAIEHGLIDRLTDALKHRGPDAQTSWVSGPIALGQCMQRTTTDSPQDKQPLVSADGRYVLVWDGRLDNREEIRRRLGGAVETKTCSEIVLLAYLEWGESCPKHLLGDFAFAVWDSASRKLFCARDRIGGGGFTFYRGANFFAFATEPDALIRLPGVPRGPNANYVASFFIPQYQNRTDRRTWISSVEVLFPAETLSVSIDGDIRISKYWEFPQLEKRAYSSFGESQEHFLDVFGEAVRCRTGNSQKSAALLSGGLDSLAVVAAADRLRKDSGAGDLHTYSVISDDGMDCIESHSIRAVSGAFGTVKHLTHVPSMIGDISLQDFADSAWDDSHPLDNSILIPKLMFRAAGEDGHDQVMHGVCGDLAMKTPAYYPAELLRRGRIMQAISECRGASQNNNELRFQRPFRIFLQSLVRALPPKVSLSLSRLRGNGFNSSVSGSLLSPEFIQKISLEERLQQQYEKDRVLQKRGERQVTLRQTLNGTCSALSAYNRVAGKSGIESVDPFSDLRVLEFFYRLPIDNLVVNGFTKYPVRAAFGSGLPPEVQWRKDKQHLGWVVTKRVLDSSKERIRSAMEDDLELVTEYIDSSAANALYRAYLNCENGEKAQTLFELLTLIFWIKRIMQL